MKVMALWTIEAPDGAIQYVVEMKNNADIFGSANRRFANRDEADRFTERMAERYDMVCCERCGRWHDVADMVKECNLCGQSHDPVCGECLAKCGPKAVCSRCRSDGTPAEQRAGAV